MSLFYGAELVILADKAVFQQSFARCIPLRRLNFFRLEADPNGLETHLYLALH